MLYANGYPVGGSGGGGDTGGHTIIDENGNSMTARAGLQFVGGANVSDDATNNKTIVDLASAGGIDGVFIDTSNVIQASTPITSSADVSYTATEDCIIVFAVIGANNNSANVQIDGVKIWEQFLSGSISQFSSSFLLKKGQTAKFHQTYSGGNGWYIAYGIQTGTTHSKFQPVIYSTEEREIGVWTDGKPFYEKTFFYTGNITPNTTTNIADLSTLDCDTILPIKTTIKESGWALIDLPCEGFRLQISETTHIVSLINSSNLSFQPANIAFIVRYTKTSDTAGSGSWTPQGVPAVHYSTTEQIIGTYLGETLYQKTWVLDSTLTLNTGWTITPISIPNNSIDRCVYAKITTSTKASSDMLAVGHNDSHTFIQLYSPVGFVADEITLQYTKSS